MRPYSKYNAKRTEVDGKKFHSKREAARYQELLLSEKANAINDLKLQPRFDLIAGITYVGDFSYFEGPKERDHLVVEDVKGFETPEFKLKWRMAKYLYPHIQWRIVK